MRARRARLRLLPFVLAVAALAVPAPAAASDMVTQWNLHATNALIRDGGQGAAATVHLAMVHGAVYDAVNAIDRGHAPYLGPLWAKRWFSQDAAAATAAYVVLTRSNPGLVDPANPGALEPSLRPLYEQSLDAIPDGAAKWGGVAVGAAAGWRMVLARRNDGRFGPFRFTPATGIGQWRPIEPSTVNDPFAWLKDVRPFMLGSSTQFGSPPPLPLTNARYAKEFDEVKAIGASNSTTRKPEQTDAARFWGVGNAVGTWAMLLRTIADERPMRTADSARYYAMLYLTAADSLITTWESKAEWSFWRPHHAIREAGGDGNDATLADASWTSLTGSPPYPEHPSGLSALGASHAKTLEQFFGTDRVAFGGTNPTAGVTRTYARFSQAAEEIVDARVWSGIHFRFGDEEGARIGRRVARWRAERGFFRHAHHGHGRHAHHGHGGGRGH
jgi:PAP2 superfamily